MSEKEDCRATSRLVPVSSLDLLRLPVPFMLPSHYHARNIKRIDKSQPCRPILLESGTFDLGHAVRSQIDLVAPRKPGHRMEDIQHDRIAEHHRHLKHPEIPLFRD